jgi:hypothetical protein
VTVSDTVFTDNTATNQGVVVDNVGTATVTGSTFTANTGGSGNGGLNNEPPAIKGFRNLFTLLVFAVLLNQRHFPILPCLLTNHAREIDDVKSFLTDSFKSFDHTDNAIFMSVFRVVRRGCRRRVVGLWVQRGESRQARLGSIAK